ncbi:Monocarboxylate transporter [Mycena chlorophos]|uniref:Monocarboxylate transporter n=1 Tax=Mycena chlorophos TaxID=658473 RepID=A0A8H6TPX2_MYCCL|nr:Monocarboxylate transporter [Mycena chlorophos]
MDTPLVIPIALPAHKHAQRTLKAVGRGLKSLLTTSVPGTLVIRKKTSGDTPPPPVLEPVQQAVPGNPPVLATTWPEDNQAQLVKLGIKVRDFAYPVGRVGHTEPTNKSPLAQAKSQKHEEEDDEDDKAPTPPTCVEETPMPRVSMSWEHPHPLLRPNTDPNYETHRIPGLFSPIQAILEVEARLRQNPRTVPILGITTRRLLTLSPDLVDLSRYHEMDLEELRRYDRRMLFQVLNGIPPAPWKPLPANWVPTPARLQRAVHYDQLLRTYDVVDRLTQANILAAAFSKQLEDEQWMRGMLLEKAQQNADAGLLDPTNPILATLDRWDTPDPSCHDVSTRQALEIWERRLDSGRAHPSYQLVVRHLKQLWAHDGRTPTNDEVVRRFALQQQHYAGVKPPFVLGQEACEIPTTTYWGPDAVWDDYRLAASTSVSELTLTQHLEHLSGMSVAELEDAAGLSAWPPPTVWTFCAHHSGWMSRPTAWQYTDLTRNMLERLLAKVEGREPVLVEDDDSGDEMGDYDAEDALLYMKPESPKRKRDDDDVGGSPKRARVEERVVELSPRKRARDEVDNTGSAAGEATPERKRARTDD